MNSFFYTWTRQKEAVDFSVERTEADEFILNDGRRVFDFISTSFQANFGHSFEPIKRRIAEQLNSMPIASPKSTFELKAKASKRLVELLGFDSGKIFYSVSGSESVENALKIARQITGRKIILARQKSYHGASLGALSVTGDWRNKPHLTFDEGTLRIPEHDDDPDLLETRRRIEEAGAENIAAVILESVSGTNGMATPPAKWFQDLEALCRELGIMLIADEVLVGFGRCAANFAFQDYGIQPDMVCMSKAITGGYIPFGAVWASQKIAEFYQNEILVCGLTNYGHPLGLAAMDAVLDTLNDPKFLEQRRKLETTFAAEVAHFDKRADVVETRCRGLMAAIYFDHPAPTWQAAFDQGLHLYSSGNFSILAPPYISSPARLKSAFSILDSISSAATV